MRPCRQSDAQRVRRQSSSAKLGLGNMLARARDGRPYLLGRSTPDVVARSQGSFQRQHFEDLRIDQWRNLLELIQTQPGQIDTVLYGVPHGTRDDFVSLAKGHAFPDQVVGEVGGSGTALQGSLAHRLPIDGNAFEHIRVNSQSSRKKI